MLGRVWESRKEGTLISHLVFELELGVTAWRGSVGGDTGRGVPDQVVQEALVSPLSNMLWIPVLELGPYPLPWWVCRPLLFFTDVEEASSSHPA